MLRKLISIITSLCLCLIVSANVIQAEEDPFPNDSNNYVTNKRLTIEDVIPDGMEYELLDKHDLKKDSKAKQIMNEIEGNIGNEDGTVLESIEIYKLKPKKDASVNENEKGCTADTELMASCDYQSAHLYTANATVYTPYKVGSSTLRQYLKSWWDVYEPPSNRVGNFYVSDAMEVWWTRDSSKFTVKNAKMYVDVQGTSWCGGTISRNYPNSDNPWDSPGWETSTTSYSWIWNSSIINVPPVNSTGTTWIQAYVKADIYYDGSFQKTINTRTEPTGF
ncbi:hypothetical protein [Brevibacillus borstelensis]|uniref:hypothetical protein n=1 Tax=Brevibacillus borstelensis TaxID=45462 RepID=UPI002E1B314F|nr:hypothetical protein [Brevibacillus borstelensis]